MPFSTKKLAILTLTAFAVLAVTGFMLRGSIARYLFNRKTSSVERRYGLMVKADELRYIGLRTIQFKGLNVLNGQDTLASVGFVETTLSLINLLALKVNPLDVTIADTEINIHNALRYRQSLGSTGVAADRATSQVPRSGSVARLGRAVRIFFGLSTAKFRVDNFSLSLADSSYAGLLTVRHWEYSGNEFTANARFTDGSTENHFALHGLADKRANAVSIAIRGENGTAKVPFLESLMGFTALFDSARLALEAKSLSSENIEILLSTRLHRLQVQGRRIAETTVETDSASASLIVKISPSAYCIDTLSRISLNKLSANVGLCYTAGDSTIQLNFRSKSQQWQELIESLPQGLFGNVSGLRLEGQFQYSLRASLSLSTPDSLKVEPTLLSKGFRIQSYGNTNFGALNDTFTHTVYHEGTCIRSIRVGEGKEYVHLDKISPFLQWAVVTSEDGNFYNHRGFDLDGIRYAMACNIREKRFARGGSTISQQLVKNLYLNRSKNIARKFEEFLIVWMIENNAIVSKERMLEIYLNIIEWGPNVYGIKEACLYYFDKKPGELSLREALFMAYIIPRPTKFRWAFEDENHLKPFMLNNFEFVSQKMLSRGHITDADYSAALSSNELRLNGKAKSVFAAQDTVPASPEDFSTILDE